MATFTGTGGDIITPGEVSDGVTSDGAPTPGVGNNDVINGKGGDDFLDGGGGTDAINGGSGFDTYHKGFGGEVLIRKNAGHVDLQDDGGSLIDLVNVERLLLDLGGEDDFVEVGNLAGTDLRKLVIDLAAEGAPGTGDGFGDLVKLTAGGDDDFITLTRSGSTLDIEGLAADVKVKNIDGGVDAFTVKGFGGDDRIGASNAGNINLLINSGKGDDEVDGGSGGDEIAGGFGEDIIRAGKGNDEVFGDDETDKTWRDTLIGGKGADDFSITTHAGTKADLILDFNPGKDQIALLGDIGGPFDEDTFVIGKKATTADHVIYNDETGKLFVDVDGQGGQKQVLVALLDNGLAMTHNDFSFI